MGIQLLSGERLDDLQNGYKIIQNKDDFCFGLDAVLLSWFAKVKPEEEVLDMCCGSGIVPVLMWARNQCGHYTGLEIQESSVRMAQRSVAFNQLEGSIDMVQGDLREAAVRFGGASFHVVTCNPPYMTGSHGLTNTHEPKAIARHEILCSLEDVVSQAAGLLRGKGRFYMVHRPFRLAEIMNILSKYKLEPKRMQLVYPYVDKQPNMVLIEGLSGGSPRITVEKPLIVYESPGVYTSDIREIYYS